MINSEIIITIQKPLFGGMGLGYYNGKAVMAPFTLPAEKVAVRIISQKKDYITSELIDVLEPSEHRIQSPCSNYGPCGGCSYLHVDYGFELLMKKMIVLDSLKRIAQTDVTRLPEIEIVSADRFNYRSHGLVRNEGGIPGFFMRGSRAHVPFDQTGCLLLSEDINKRLRDCRFIEKEFKIAADYMNDIHIGNSGICIIREQVNNVMYERDIDLFFQANRFLREAMLDIVLELSELTPDESFIDIGCGVGFFSLFLARHSKSGSGIDINKSSISWAKQNAELNGINNIDFKAFAGEDIKPARINSDLIVLDPPRAGLSKRLRKIIITQSPRKIVYASCDPATFSRDLRDILLSGYSLNRICLLDMFPGTHHIEIIAQLKRSGGNFA